MPVRTDESGTRWVEMEWSVPGTPEQVWQAIATGPGYTAWFTPAVVEERVGGAIRFDMGESGQSAGEVTVWEPPQRFGYVERDWTKGAPPVATEVTVSARSGGRCLVRMIHSLVAATADWDEQMEGFEAGWPGFVEVLRLYLSHWAGRKAAVALAMTSVKASPLDAWKQLTDGLGLAGADVGEERVLQVAGKPSAVVERVEQGDRQRYILLRLDPAAPGTALIGICGVGDATYASMAFYLYGDDAGQRAAACEAGLRDWLGKTFKPTEP